ncbi:MAG: glycosyltransferase [Candidatus Krumholzibacteriota bacterium]|nr:glycosyltransferase [Candidatus Krumholzibacteriota bacterium]
MNMKILVIAFEFPPLGGGSVQRSVKMVKYLSSFGHEVRVLTVRDEDYANWFDQKYDPTLLNEVPSGVVIHRVSSGFPAWYWDIIDKPFSHGLIRLFSFGDPVVRFWKPGFEHAFAQIIDRERWRPDVVWCTSPPYGACVLASRECNKRGIPLVNDFQDPWTLWSHSAFPSYFHYRFIRKQELEAIRYCKYFILTTEQSRIDYIREYPFLNVDKIRVIHNGYDDEDFKNQSFHRNINDDTIRITHIGHFYYIPSERELMLRVWWKRLPHQWIRYRKRVEDWLYRSPYFFLLGLRRFRDKWPSEVNNLRVRFVGKPPYWLDNMLTETGTKEIVEIIPYVSHEECLKIEAESDAFLLTSAKVSGGLDYTIGGKFFEYLYWDRPILGVLTDGSMKTLLEQSGLGIFADPDDHESVSNAIKTIMNIKYSDNYPHRAAGFLERFSRMRLARILEKLLLEASGLD